MPYTISPRLVVTAFLVAAASAGKWSVASSDRRISGAAQSVGRGKNSDSKMVSCSCVRRKWVSKEASEWVREGASEQLSRCEIGGDYLWPSHKGWKYDVHEVNQWEWCRREISSSIHSWSWSLITLKVYVQLEFMWSCCQRDQHIVERTSSLNVSMKWNRNKRL